MRARPLRIGKKVMVATNTPLPGDGSPRKGGEPMEGLPLTSLISVVAVLAIVMLAVYLAVKK